jgi:hypothetical protein
MKYPINYKSLSTNIEYHSEVNALHKEAETYLMGFKWCRTIKNSFLYTNIGYVLCIFLFEIDNTQSKDDNFLWIIVGDLPTMYLDVYGSKTTKEALEGYIELAEDWIYNIKAGQSVNNCYPFKAEPTLEMAELLEKRTLFIKNQLLNNVEDITAMI